MRPISPLWLSLLLFCLPLLASLPISQLLGGPLAHQLLQEKKEEIETALAERHRLLDDNIRSQLTQFRFDCGEQDMELLRDPRFYNSHIRIQGILLASGGGCSSLGLDLPFTPAELPPYANQEPFGIAATQARFHTEQELVAYYRTGGNIVYWVLNNSWSHALLQTPCSNCFYLEFGQQQPGASSPIFPRGDSSIKQEEGSQSLSFFDPNQEIRQTLWAGEALERYAQQQARHYGLWGGAAVGALLVAAYWGLRNYRRSLKGLLHGWPSPAQLTFELTERKPITDIETAIAEIGALQQQGYHFKLDDFGTGYGGFAYLQQLGIRQIKIDKMFVDTIGTDDLKRSVLDATIAFGRESGMEMIAEGVERQSQVDYLGQRGVHLIQGYVYAQPMALTKLKIWLLAWYQNHTGER